MTDEARFGIATVLRPYAGFEAVYQGVVTTTAIAFTPEGVARDELAGNPGYSPNLQKGVSVPFGASVVLYLPYLGPRIVDPVSAYIWMIGWRTRTLHDYRTARIPYHNPRQGAGAPDTTLSPSARVALPVAWEAITYQQAEPSGTGANARALGDLVADDVAIFGSGVALPQPLMPNGALSDIQQGIVNPATFGNEARAPLFLTHETQAKGDELILQLRRLSTVANPNWDFTLGVGVDAEVSLFFGTGSGAAIPSVGVYALAGRTS